MDNDVYLIWSNEHRGWWGPAERGYVREISKAGRYTRERAIEICRDARWTAAHIGMISEIPVREADLVACFDGGMIPAGVL